MVRFDNKPSLEGINDRGVAALNSGRRGVRAGIMIRMAA